MRNGIASNFSFSENKERTNRLINGLRVGVLLQGPGTEILYSNKAALGMLGLTEDELSGRSSFHPDWNVIREDGSPFPGPEHPVPVAIRTKKTVDNVVMGVFRPITRDRVWLLVNAEPLLDSTGKVKEVICSFSDITERKTAEEKLTWLYQNLEMRAFELATSNADLEKFVYAATHDLQEPLRRIGSFVQLLKKKYEKQLDEQASEYINYAVEGANRMKKLILDLLEYSKFSSSGKNLSDTDMNDVLKQVSGLLSKRLRDINGRLIAHPLPVVFADPALITQLFENLVDNALKYRGDNAPIIQINCSEKNDKFVFSVSDNGIGIDTGYSEKIFNLFQRLHSNGAYEGTGVGLAICKKIVQLHRGDIWVTSEPGKGSTFYFTIPKEQTAVYEKL
ncbi:MAG: sensor histidine kinase [Bacteroidota bacterium]